MGKPKKAGAVQGTPHHSTNKSQPDGKNFGRTTKSLANTRGSNAARPEGKLGKMLALLRRREGTTVEQMMKATGWQAHSVRGAMSGALKKRQGLVIASTKTGNTRTYRIVAGEKG